MAFRLVADVLDHSPYEGSALVVHLVLASHANDDGICWPSVGRIAAQSRLGERQVQRVLAGMETDQIIERSPRPGSSNFIRVRYQAPVTPASGGDDTDDTPGGDTGDTQNLSLGIGNEPRSASPRDRKLDPLFEALAEACELDWQDGLTKTQRGRLNAATKELKEIEATPEDIRRRARKYRQLFPQVVTTPQGLIGNWGLLGSAPPKMTATPEDQQREQERVSATPEERARGIAAVTEIAQRLRLGQDGE